MKVLVINSVCGIRSTGRIATEIAEEYIKQGHEVIIAYGRETVPKQYKSISKRIGTSISININAFESRIFDNDGFTARQATARFLKWAEFYNPDLLWLHNLHGYYINIKQLFTWIKKRPNMEVRWTLHDCWSFTGHCSHFDYVKCYKWKKHCEKCQQKKEYPASLFFDGSGRNFENKRKLFTGVKKMTIVTPSKWLANQVKAGFLKEYPIVIVNNTVDTEVFKPTNSDIKKTLGIENKRIILGVASQWQPLKGFQDFFKLRELLSDEYVIVLVGVTSKQKQKLLPSMIGIERTNNPLELAKLYSAADVFFNPTYQDTYPTVNLEAKACGTTVITYDTGGSPESVEPENVFEQGDLENVVKRIKYLSGNYIRINEAKS